MNIKKESITIVIVGNWNLYIFTPEWIAKKIFNEEKLKIDVAVNIGLPNRFTSETKKVMLIPTETNMTLMALDSSDDCLVNIEKIAAKIISQLPVTPIKAFGINYCYVEENNSELAYIFNLPDKSHLLKAGFTDEECFIQRSHKLSNCTLNLKSSRIPNGASFDFNFHYNINSAEKASGALNGAVRANKQIAESILEEAYAIRLTPERAQ